MLRRLLLPVFVLLVLSPAVVGDAQVAPPAPGPAPAPVPAEDAESTQTLRVAFQEGSRPTLDPHTCRDNVSFRLVSLAYETLYMWVPGPSTGSGQAPQPRVAPCLAKAMPVVSEDGLTLTIKLDTTAKFHNSPCFGETRTRTLKASDVIHSFKRLSTFSDEGMYWMAAGLIEGLDKYGEQARYDMAYETTDKKVAGLSAPDDETLVIKLTRPCASFVSMLAHPSFSILPREAIDHFSGQLRTRMVGTGPYRLNAVASEDLYVFKRWDDYRGDKPDFARVTLTARGYPHLFTGLKDGTLHESPLHEVYYDHLVKDGKLRGEWADMPAEIVDLPEHGYYFLAFNMSDPIWGAMDADGRALRRAVSLALKRQDLIMNAGWATDWNTPQRDLFPIGMEFEDTGKELGFGKTDEAEAKKLLNGSKYKGGIDPSTGQPLILKFMATDPTGLRRDFANLYEQFASSLRAACKSLGIALDVRYVGVGLYRDEVPTTKDHVVQAGWFLDYPDPVNYLQLFWGENAGVHEEFNNVARYESESFNKAFEELQRTVPSDENREKRQELVRTMAAELAKDQPIIPLFHQRNVTLRRTDVEWPNMPRQTFNDLRFAGIPE